MGGPFFFCAFKPYLPSFWIPMFVGPARIGDFIGRHTGIADKNTFVIRSIGAQDFVGRGLIIPATCIVTPYTFVKAVVEIKILKMFIMF